MKIEQIEEIDTANVLEEIVKQEENYTFEGRMKLHDEIESHYDEQLKVLDKKIKYYSKKVAKAKKHAQKQVKKEKKRLDKLYTGFVERGMSSDAQKVQEKLDEIEKHRMNCITTYLQQNVKGLGSEWKHSSIIEKLTLNHVTPRNSFEEAAYGAYVKQRVELTQKRNSHSKWKWLNPFSTVHAAGVGLGGVSGAIFGLLADVIINEGAYIAAKTLAYIGIGTAIGAVAGIGAISTLNYIADKDMLSRRSLKKEMKKYRAFTLEKMTKNYLETQT